MSKHKNLILILAALILFAYAGLISIYPAVMTSGFDKIKFEEKAYKATGLITRVGSLEYKMTPDLTLIITIRNWSSKYIDYQDCFDAELIEIKTGAFSPITKNFNIKEMNLRHVKFANQVLPDKQNKLAYLPKSFEVSAFDTNLIKITPGPVNVQDFQIKNIAPNYYKENNREKAKYSKTAVKRFLEKLNIRFVEVR